MAETVKYVRLQGYAQIGIAEDGRLTLVMCDPGGTPLPNVERILFSFIPGTEKEPKTTPVELSPPIKFLNIDLLAEFNQNDFQLYQPLWDILHPDLTWDTALDPTPETMPHMNPTGPP